MFKKSVINTRFLICLMASLMAGIALVNAVGQLGGPTYSNDSVSCTDTDNGIDYGVNGIVTHKENQYEDECVLFGFLLKENYCDNGIRRSRYHKCPNNCEEGACVSEQETCIDTDGGKNELVAGKTYLEEEGEIYYDHCSGTSLTEYYCTYDDSSNEILIEEEEIDCEDCDNGACIQLPQNLTCTWIDGCCKTSQDCPASAPYCIQSAAYEGPKLGLGVCNPGYDGHYCDKSEGAADCRSGFTCNTNCDNYEELSWCSPMYPEGSQTIDDGIRCESCYAENKICKSKKITVSISDLTNAVNNAFNDYFANPQSSKLTVPELKDLIKAHIDAFGVVEIVDLSYIGNNSGERLIEIYNKAKDSTTKNILKTEVKVINGVPRILINGEDKIKTINFIYSYVPLEGNDYSNGKWLSGVKKQIDGMPKLGANTLVLIVWWAELSEAQGSINFAPLDKAMKYAEQKGIYVVLTPKTTLELPDWWVKENNFPRAGAIVTISGIPPQLPDPCIPKEKDATQACIPKEICAVGDSRCCSVPKDELYCCLRDTSVKTVFAKNGLPSCLSTTKNPKYVTCTDCETDSYGWKYNIPAYGSKKFRQDYGSFITALVNRYKNFPSLIGWMLQLGPSGEDVYGPSYIYLEPIYGVGASNKLDQVVDYSDNSQQLFKKWIKTKYKSNAEIQAAWGDSSITLNNVKLPDPRKLFKDGKANQFPDDFTLHYFVELSDLTKAGKDLYYFRESNRNYDRDYFAKIFKENDKNHILIYIGGNNDAIFTNPYIDAIDSQNHVEYTRGGNDEANVIALSIAQNKKNGKASTFGIESFTARPDWSQRASFDYEQQKTALIHAGQTILCNGGHFGYASEIKSMVPDGQPAWSSEQEKEALSELASYIPSDDCVCKLIPSDGNVLGRYTIAQMAQILGLSDFSKCNSSSTPNQNLSQL